MALRTETRIGAIVLAAALALAAEPLSVTVRHKHLRGAKPATLTFTDTELRLDEPKHARTWKYADIQRLELTPSSVELVTYVDTRWQLGRDREYSFDRLKPGDAQRIYTLLAAKMDRRFIPRMPGEPAVVLWQAPAKLLRSTGGTLGQLRIGADDISFSAAGKGESHTWLYRDVTDFSREGPLDLTLGGRRFQLKQEMTEQQYNHLWQRIQRANGLKLFGSTSETHHD